MFAITLKPVCLRPERGISSSGRALRSQRRGGQFESAMLHNIKSKNLVNKQLTRLYYFYGETLVKQTFWPIQFQSIFAKCFCWFPSSNFPLLWCPIRSLFSQRFFYSVDFVGFYSASPFSARSFWNFSSLKNGSPHEFSSLHLSRITPTGLPLP